METTGIKKETANLPPLVKGSTTYKMVIPFKVEEKIRYLQRKFPSTEWSGVLFTTYEGTFEDGNLTITCQDIYPMDLGNATYTEYNMDETVAGYIAENPDLFYCDLALVHSHHSMCTYFSSTDLNTLKEEGNERNCFVSLIVNNAGEYNAAITRKVQVQQEVITKDMGSSYNFFGEGTKLLCSTPGTETVTTINRPIVEYYMLNIEKEEVFNPLEYLDKRFEEIEKKKKEESKSLVSLLPSKNVSIWEDRDWTFNDWMKKKEIEEPKVIQQNLFDDKTMKEMETGLDSEWHPDEKIVHNYVVKMLTCSLMINPDSIDLQSWVIHNMQRKYDEIFAAPGSFDSWAEFAADFLLSNFYDEKLPEEAYYDPDVIMSTVAADMYAELSEYEGYNMYIKEYMEVLERFMV